ncbi:MAG: TerB family tellurite resistance protein [Bacteroidota bacterium]|nr:TerB family tellurite resistance protein [Bacteroidota bacterium]
MESSQEILHGSSDTEKGAYLGAIASIATADRTASEEEIEYLRKLAEAAGLSNDQKDAVIRAATEISDADAKRCLDVLKTSELKYSLVTDLIAFAKSDNSYSDEEQKTIQKMSDYLGVNKEQFSLLDHFTNKAISTASANAASNQSASSTNASSSNSQPQETDFLSSLGLKDKLESVGIKGSGLLKGLLGIAAPMLLAKMVTSGLSRNQGYGGGVFGNSGGMFGGGGGLMGGGLGSIFSMFSGGGGYRRSGGLLSRIFGGF